jgi:DNA-directed RNA polymerase sigma subunit (sigma70/sigma32)
MHLTRERIRQIEKTALKRLRHFSPLQETAQTYARHSRCGHTGAVA